MATEDSPELMTVKETAEYLRIPLPTVYILFKGDNYRPYKLEVVGELKEAF